MSKQLRNETIDKVIKELEALKNDADAQIEISQELETVFKGFEYNLDRRHIRIDLFYDYKKINKFDY